MKKISLDLNDLIDSQNVINDFLSKKEMLTINGGNDEESLYSKIEPSYPDTTYVRGNKPLPPIEKKITDL
ncbi:MAG: hypothetical protein ACK5KP_01500 [Paludibacteraceae bacterium]